MSTITTQPSTEARGDHVQPGPSITTQETRLCERCLSLQLGTYEEEMCQVQYGTIAKVKVWSLNPQCSFCYKFRGLFDIITNSSPYGTICEEFDLSREAFHILDERGSFYGHYLGIYSEVPQSAIRFFPGQVLFKKYVPHRVDTVLPLAKALSPGSPDFEAMKLELRTCQESHDECRSKILPIPTHLLRLIDCKNRRISQAVGQPYVCLSYVWGQRVDAEAPCEAELLPDNLPKTIEDAILVALEMDVPYLWVDRYCIDQNNASEKHNIIQNMDKIYQGAEFTIIAIAANPHLGLPGVRGTPRKPQHRLTFNRYTFIAAEEATNEIHRSAWALRGWTYQEMHLSRRRLVFTESQMYFQCQFAHHIESLSPGVISGRLKDPYRVFPLHSSRATMEATMEGLTLCLKEYYRRELSYKVDTIDAFIGVVNSFSLSSTPWGAKLGHFYGLLLVYSNSDHSLVRKSFLKGLSWSVKSSHYKHVAWTDTFPSWTWASFKADRQLHALGELHYPVPNIETSGWDEYIRGVSEIEVELEHRSRGVENITAFRGDDYKDYWPWIDITTWVQQQAVLDVSADQGFVHVYGERILVQDPTALERGQVQVMCLEAGQVPFKDYAKLVGLVIVEVKPGVYLRLAQLEVIIWPWYIVGYDRYWAELPPDAKAEDEFARQARLWGWLRCEWQGPPSLEKLVGEPWCKQKLRLV